MTTLAAQYGPNIQLNYRWNLKDTKTPSNDENLSECASQLFTIFAEWNSEYFRLKRYFRTRGGTRTASSASDSGPKTTGRIRSTASSPRAAAETPGMRISKYRRSKCFKKAGGAKSSKSISKSLIYSPYYKKIFYRKYATIWVLNFVAFVYHQGQPLLY